jgi:hypothetical protein
MARDLYGEMLSRALNRGAPPGHFPAYINPGEAAQLRAQGGGVPLGGGQYVANGLPSYQQPSAADIQGAIDMAIGLGVDQTTAEFGRSGPAAPLEQVGPAPGAAASLVDVDVSRSLPTPPRTFNQQDAVGAEVARLSSALREPAPAAPPPRELTAYEQQVAPTGFNPPSPLLSPEYLEELPWRENPNLLAAELTQRTAKAENARALKIQEAAVEEVEGSYNYTRGTPEGEALIMDALRANPLPHTNAELSKLNFEVIINNEQLTARQMADRLSANISEDGTGPLSPVAGAADRAEKRGYGDDPNLKDTLRSLTLLTPEGEYAVMGGGVSMPKELIAFGPALAGSAFGFLAPPALGVLPWVAGAGLSGWGKAKYPDLYQSVAGSPMGNLLGMRGDSEERALPEIDLANIRRLVAGGRTVGAPDVPIAEPPFVPPQSVTDEDVVEDAVEEDARQFATLSPEIEARLAASRSYPPEIENLLAANRSYGVDQRADALARLLNPTQ